ncbi:MAG TPA: hypothetical protein VKZ49_03585 [Polyangiaceae bacterium]|nr:hypothetical protein [Polyangiaceae bacterium]
MVGRRRVQRALASAAPSTAPESIATDAGHGPPPPLPASEQAAARLNQLFESLAGRGLVERIRAYDD